MRVKGPCGRGAAWFKSAGRSLPGWDGRAAFAARIPLFVPREAKEMKNSHPSCQGFRNPLHQVKRLRPRQPKESRFPGSVGINLEEGEKFRGVLNFIDQDGRRKPLEKKGGIPPGPLPQIGVVERKVLPFSLAQLFQKSRFSSLAGPGDHQNRKLS